MLEICVSGFVIISLVGSLLLWRALAAAKWADYSLQGADDVYVLEPREDKVHVRKPVWR